jgi:TolB-like protein
MAASFSPRGDGLAIARRTLDIQFGEFAINLARQELRRGDKHVPVEPQVFDLLVHLARNHNRVVSKSEVIDVVWKGRIVSEAAVSSRVSAARQAIGDNGTDQKFIRTYHKRGFRFVGPLRQPLAPRDAVPAVTQSNREGPIPPRQSPERARVVVLPFQNLSGDPAQETLADSFTEDIIAGLARQQWFSVIARSASFAFKGVSIDVRSIAAELGVRYVLEGSVRRSGNKLRVTAQLIDAAKRVHVWADRHDSVFSNVDGSQDEITARVIDAVGSQVIMTEAARLRQWPTQDLNAHDLMMQALPHMWRASTAEQCRAQDLLARAASLDAEHLHAQIHALLGWTFVSMFNLDSRAPINELTEKALDSGATALTLDDREHWGHLVLGLGHARRRRTEEAIRHLSRAIELSPNFALAHAGLGYALACGGQPESGLQSLERAKRLSPVDPFLAVYGPVVRYMALFALGRYEETIAVCRCAAARYPNHAGARRLMTVSLGLLDKIEQANESLVQTLALQPGLSSDHVINATVYARESDRSRFLLGLRKAGLNN